MAQVSIVVPVYFNAPSLPLMLEHLQAVAAAAVPHLFEFIFVDDGSGDDSYAVLLTLAARDDRVRVVQLARNFGSNLAILAGLSVARGDCVAYIAADLQDPPESLLAMIRAWEGGSAVVLAVRRTRLGDPWLSRLFAYGFSRIFQRLVFKDFSPEGIGFALLDHRVARVLVECSEKNVHLAGLILWAGFRRSVVYYDRVERQHGRSRWSFARKVNHSIDAFVGFSNLPLRVASTLGFVLAIVGGLYAALIVLLRVWGDIAVEGWTALTVIVLLTSGMQLIGMGVMGEYLWRSLDASRRRPPYIIAELTNVSAPPPPR